MKRFFLNRLLFVFILIYSVNTNSQTFYVKGDSLLTEKIFLEQLDVLKKEFKNKSVRFKIIEKVIRNDSIILNPTIMVRDKRFPFNNDIYKLLNHSIPEFLLKNIQGEFESNSSVIRKTTLVCIWSSKYFDGRDIIKKLNDLDASDDVDVVVICTDKLKDKWIKKFARFPILLDGSRYIKKSLGVSTYPTYFIVNDSQEIKYIFSKYPEKTDKRKIYSINPTIQKIIEEIKI